MKKLSTDQQTSWTNMLLCHQFAVRELETKLDILNDEYNNIYDYNPIEHIKTRIKTVDSIKKKLDKVGASHTIKNAEKYLNDIGGVRIVCAFEDDVYQLFRTLKKQDDIEILRVKDYIKKPKTNGYRSLHIIVEIPVYMSKGKRSLKVELQIRTIVMDFWASLEHKLYYKKGLEIPGEVEIGLKDCASISAILDEKMLGMKKSIEAIT